MLQRYGKNLNVHYLNLSSSLSQRRNNTVLWYAIVYPYVTRTFCNQYL